MSEKITVPTLGESVTEATVSKWLKSQGYEHCVNVLGGIDAWAALIDRNIRRY